MRLGYAPLKVLAGIDSLYSMNLKDHNCTVYLIVKQRRLSFPTSVTTSNSAFDLVHGDVWGLTEFHTIDGRCTS